MLYKIIKMTLLDKSVLYVDLCIIENPVLDSFVNDFLNINNPCTSSCMNEL